MVNNKFDPTSASCESDFDSEADSLSSTDK